MAGYHTHESRVAAKTTRTPETQSTRSNTAQIDTGSVVDLQKVIGNKAVQRLMDGIGIQAKMTVGAADDAYEREADTVAAQVMSGSSESSVQRAGEEDELAMKRIQRESEGGEMEEEEIALKRIQRESEGGESEDEELMLARTDEQVDMSGSFDVGGDIEQQIASTSGSGQSMPQESTSFFADRMGHDFSNVNIHTDTQSDTLNRSLGSRAFTTGNDIYFRGGEFNPGSSGGQELLAHELTHVVQQTGGAPVQAKRDEKDCC
ncbi:MAG: DUF4157 domain-containing protein [Pleurocapsa minor GSE-CHR-MK-17-07R]|nr:DUF4157 domain-containing protein [Pleurocapsa minor GSE-CHR-MK 17-07R]